MENVINPFKRAGIGLLTIGLLDIGVMVYCIMNRISYSSNFNIFAVIAGIFLLRGGVKTARVIRWFFAFFIFGSFGVILLFPLLLPLDLLATQFKSNPVGVLFSYSIPALYLAIIIWIYLELSTTSSKEIYKAKGYKTGHPKSAFYASLVMIIVAGGLFYFLLGGESATTAKELAKKQLGDAYTYHITSMATSGASGTATVTAYNKDEIKNIRVQW